MGMTSGAECVVREVGNQAAFAEDVNDPEGSSNFTQTYTLHVIRKGSATPGDDSLVHVTFHITIVNGEVTSEVVVESAECK